MGHFFLSFSRRVGTRIPHGHRRRRGGVAVCAARQSAKERVSSLQASTGDALDTCKLDDVNRGPTLLNAERLGSVTLAPAARPPDRERDRECVAYEFPASVRWSYPSAALSVSSTTAEQHNNTTLRPDRQLQLQFVMSSGRFSSLFLCPATCMFLNSPRTHCPAVWNAWYRSVFSLNSDASWHPVFCKRRTIPCIAYIFQETPASAPASITQENGGNNGIEKARAGEP